MEEIKMDRVINLKGYFWPFPYVKSKRLLGQMRVGEVLRIIVDHGGAVANLPKSLEGDGQTILRIAKLNEIDWEVIVRKER